MKHYDAIFFDLDGTLLHIPQDLFTNGTIAGETAAVAPKLGIDPHLFVKTLSGSIAAMISNDGKISNETLFYNFVEPVFGSNRQELDQCFEEYYNNEFKNLSVLARPNPDAVTLIKEARRVAEHVILATLPVFPSSAQAVRLSWIGLSATDFDLVTDFSNSSYCKPNPAYFLSLLERFSLDPQRCLMVGNDTHDDIAAATSAGIPCYLITDFLIDHGEPLPSCPSGSFKEFLYFILQHE